MSSRELLTLTHLNDGDGSLRFRVTSNRQPDLDFVLNSQNALASLQARYADFSLVSPFVQLLLQRQPRELLIDYLCTETADLARFALSLDIKVGVSAGLDGVILGDSDADQRWGTALLDGLRVAMASDHSTADVETDFAYEHYAFSARNHALLIKWVERVARWFEGRQKILDLGCGTGVFLDQMARKGVRAEGVDSNKASICYAESLGLNVRCVDMREGLSAVDAEYDAIHCAHVVEHMTPTELAETMGYVYRALKPGGRAVFVFPDPESIRSQLLGFWRDPTHVRFYHPDTVESMARAAGFSLEFNSQKEDARRVVPFSFEPPEDEQGEVIAQPTSGEVEPTLLLRLSALERQVAVQEHWIRQLWAVNQTWAWADDAVLTFLRPQAP
ncbi:MAG: class I SAM-dependent methyltransferase [Halieaceae bacterium]